MIKNILKVPSGFLLVYSLREFFSFASSHHNDELIIGFYCLAAAVLLTILPEVISNRIQESRRYGSETVNPEKIEAFLLKEYGTPKHEILDHVRLALKACNPSRLVTRVRHF